MWFILVWALSLPSLLSLCTSTEETYEIALEWLPSASGRMLDLCHPERFWGFLSITGWCMVIRMLAAKVWTVMMRVGWRLQWKGWLQCRQDRVQWYVCWWLGRKADLTYQQKILTTRVVNTIKEGQDNIPDSKLSTWSGMSKVGSLLCQDIRLSACLIF